jgi:protoheme IX farnesyltransferase
MTTLPIVPSLPAAPTRADWSATLTALFALTKPQLAFMSVLTAMVAYATAHPPAGTALVTLVGTSLAAAGALSLNQWWERAPDAQMRRTRGRPLPQARLQPWVALGWSLALSLGGIVLLAAQVNLPAAAIAALTILIYGLVYTPLKRRTRWATEIGAISGALPPLLGNAAAGDLWAAQGTALAAVLLVWQMPHFFAIGWRHRADYRAAGFRLLPAVDPTGRQTAAWSLAYSALLVPVSLAPWALGYFGAFYGVPVALAGVIFFGYACRFAQAAGHRGDAARQLFLASTAYLPLVLGALVADHVWSS